MISIFIPVLGRAHQIKPLLENISATTVAEHTTVFICSPHDTEAREAAWFSLAGAELVRLDDPLQRPVAELQSAPAWLTAASPDRDRIPA